MKSQKITKLLPNYHSLDLARKVRHQTTSLIQAFDPLNTGTFKQEDLIKILKTFIEADETELRYVTSNMFRYDKDNDGLINCLELINFFLEVSWGEIAIQRLHRKGYYKNGSARMIEEKEFFNTMQYILSFIKLTSNQNEGKLLFKDIDTNHDGLISYNQYFTFLRTYFGSQSLAANEEQDKDIPKKLELPVDLVFDGRDRFKRFVLAQSKLAFIRFNVNHDLDFTKGEIKNLLEDLFQVQSINLEPTTERLVNSQSLGDFQRLTVLLIMLQFGQIILGRLHNEGAIVEWRTRKLTKEDFIKVIRNGCSYMNVFPDKQLVMSLFSIVSVDGAPIPYSNYKHFIVNLFCSSKEEINFIKEDIIDPIGVVRQKIIKAKTSGDNHLVHEACWRELQKMFKKHNITGTGLTKGQLSEIISTIFRNINNHQRNVLVWSAFNTLETLTMRFSDFVPWILQKLFHYGFVSFYKNENAPASLRMNVEEFKRFMRTVYWFIPNQLEGEYQKLYNSISANPEKGVDRNEILGWVSGKLAMRY